MTSRGSPDDNERHHPFCGLISSMHSFGLSNGRYGISRHGRRKRLAATRIKEQ